MVRLMRRAIRKRVRARTRTSQRERGKPRGGLGTMVMVKVAMLLVRMEGMTVMIEDVAFSTTR